MVVDHKQDLEQMAAEIRRARVRNALAVAGALGLFALLLINQDSDHLPYVFLFALAAFCLVFLVIYIRLTVQQRRMADRHRAARKRTCR